MWDPQALSSACCHCCALSVKHLLCTREFFCIFSSLSSVSDLLGARIHIQFVCSRVVLGQRFPLGTAHLSTLSSMVASASCWWGIPHPSFPVFGTQKGTQGSCMLSKPATIELRPPQGALSSSLNWSFLRFRG